MEAKKKDRQEAGARNSRGLGQQRHRHRLITLSFGERDPRDEPDRFVVMEEVGLRRHRRAAKRARVCRRALELGHTCAAERMETGQLIDLLARLQADHARVALVQVAHDPRRAPRSPQEHIF